MFTIHVMPATQDAKGELFRLQTAIMWISRALHHQNLHQGEKTLSNKKCPKHVECVCLTVTYHHRSEVDTEKKAIRL